MPIVTVDQVLALTPTYFDDFPSRDRNLIECSDKMAPVLNKMGFFCIHSFQESKHQCFVFERDPWDSQIVLRQPTE